MQVDNLKCLIDVQDVKEAFASIGSHIDTRTISVFGVENTALVIAYDLCCLIPLLLIDF